MPGIPIIGSHNTPNPQMSNQEMKLMLLQHHKHLDMLSRMLAKAQLQILALARHLQLSPAQVSALFLEEQVNQQYYKDVYTEQTKTIKEDKLKERSKDSIIKEMLNINEKNNMDPIALQTAVSAALAPVAAQFGGEFKGTFTFTPTNAAETGSFDVLPAAPDATPATPSTPTPVAA